VLRTVSVTMLANAAKHQNYKSD